VEAVVCGYCRKKQPIASVPKTAKQIQSEKTQRGCLVLLGTIVVLFVIYSLISGGVPANKVDACMSAHKDLGTDEAYKLCKELYPDEK
jgi:hypothetical protein